MDLDTVYNKQPNFLSRRAGNEYVILDFRPDTPEKSPSHWLNSSGAYIWDLLDGKRTLKEILDILVCQFGILPQQGAEDLQALMLQLRAVGAVGETLRTIS